MLKKLRLRFIFINMALVTVLLLVIFGLVLNFTAQAQREQSLQLMRTLADGPHRTDRPGEHSGQVQLPYFIAQINASGQISITSGGYYDLSDQELLQKVISEAQSQQEETGRLRKYSLRFFRQETKMGQKLVFVDTTAEEATMRQLSFICIVIGVLSFCLFLILSIWWARWAVWPVSQAWEHQRQFITDASHELKTPIAVILTSAELLATSECAPEEKGQFVQNILTMSHRMRSLVEGLLELARVDNGAVAENFREFNLSTLVAEGVLPFEPMFYEHGLTLQTQTDEDIRIRGSESHIRQVLEILLDNAVKYAHSPGTVYVRLLRQSGYCSLLVENPGPAISKEDRENIFKRFYRVDKARSGGSYGLGLSIAYSIVAEHRGRITVQSKDGTNTFIVLLPTLL